MLRAGVATRLCTRSARCSFTNRRKPRRPRWWTRSRDYSGVRVFSLPGVGNAQTRRHIALGKMQAELHARGAGFSAL